ncbi:sugar kinase [Kitasatospora sp. NPDC006697]|uniref:sugar kinase n=1 Tax=Kitasatospora sp. NPDC006697 TaxID=3364020 RepID=UPI003684156E
MGEVPEAVCLGESMAVLLPDRPGSLAAVESFRAAVGGAESNTACALAALGIPTAWVSRVGDDGFGRRLLAEVAAHGVDTSAVAVDPERPTGLYLKEGGPHGPVPRYYREGSAAAALDPGYLAEPAVARLLAGARLLHLSGITPALSDGCLALVRELLARPGRPTVSFDLNWRPALWRRRDPAVLRELLDAADLVLFGADEAAAALGTGDPAELRALLPHPATLVVKDAAHQATAVDRDGRHSTEPALAVTVVEPTGAGDAFAAGYLAGTLRGLDQHRRLRLGHLAAAAALTAHGDQGTLPPADRRAALLDASPADWAAVRVGPEGWRLP